MTVSFDNVELSELPTPGWLGLGLAALSFSFGSYTLITWPVVGGSLGEPLLLATVGTLFGSYIAYVTASPEVAGTCDNCGRDVEVNASQNKADEAVEVVSTGHPKRMDAGPLSIPVSLHRETHLYCSGSCASADSERRKGAVPATRSPRRPSVEATRADGGIDQTDDQGQLQPETGDSDQ